MLAFQLNPDFEKNFFEAHSGEILFILLSALMVITLMVVVPQLLRTHLRKLEMQHLEHLKAIENGVPISPADERARVAGRTAMLVPMVVMCAAATVTCFLVAYKAPDVLSVSLAVWVVAGVVSLAAITGGVALIGRLAQLQSGDEEEIPENPLESSHRRHSIH